MARYKFSVAGELDLKRIWFRGREEFGESQADDEIRPGYRRAACSVGSIYYRIHGGKVEIMRGLRRQDAQITL